MENQRPGKIVRGFSMVDPKMVSELHTDIKARGKDKYEIARFNFTLPDFSQFDEEFLAFLMKDLIENATLKALEESGNLNWWTKCSSLQRLYPLLTSGDGNCLLHAASLGIWGVHDRWLNLRQDVYDTLSASADETTLKRRWLWYEWQKNMQEGLLLSADEWESEWKSVLNMADAKPRSPRQPLSTVPEGSPVEDKESSISLTRTSSNSWQPRYESLEEIHICSLAHVLRRPIIVVSDNWVYDFEGKPMSPIPFAGVYLPVECDPSECCRIPLVLAYSSSHFSPVVSTELSTQAMQSHNDTSAEDKTLGDNTSGNKSKDPLDKVSKSSNVEESTASTIQAAMSSIYQVTKSTILQAAKSFSESSVQTPLPTNKPIGAAIPLVDKDFKTLPLPFAVDPGPNWDWLKNENNEDTIKKKSLTDEERMSLVKKYLDVNEIDINKESCLDADTKPSAENNSSNKASENQTNTSNQRLPVAILPCDNQPHFYKEVTTGYLEKARERFDFEKETKIVEPKKTASLKCANDGCDLYGTVDNNYLCTKCFQHQSQSIVKFVPPPSYHPPSYSEVTGGNNVYYPPSFEASENTKTLKEMSIECRAPGCMFYGTPDKNGFCSKCFNENKK